MKLIICGSRPPLNVRRSTGSMAQWYKEASIFVTNSLLHVDTSMFEKVVSGMAAGFDIVGAEWATKVGLPVKGFPADWENYGKAAGFKRNIQMAKYAANGMVIAFWDMQSPGTSHMLDTARGFSLLRVVIPVDGVLGFPKR